MTNPTELESQLSAISLGGLRYFESVTSTNDLAAQWAQAGCPDFSVVVADEQTAGRGRGGRKWFTPAGAALAVSVVLRADEQTGNWKTFENTARLNGLGALAVCQALQQQYALPAQIKWPNDVLIAGQKVAGVLAEAHWIGDQLAAVVLGIGINIAASAVPPKDWDAANPQPFRAGSVEAALGRPVARWALLREVLLAVQAWRVQLSAPEFIEEWEQNLAWRGQWVQIIPPEPGASPRLGQIISLRADGALRVRDVAGALMDLRSGEIHPSDPPLDGFRLRPVDSSTK